LKQVLKVWNSEHFGLLKSQKIAAEEETRNLDLKEEKSNLCEEGVNRRKELFAKIRCISSMEISLPY